MKQRKSATKPKAQVREVFEILPLEWKNQPGHNNYYCHTMPGILTIKSSDRGFVARYGFTVIRYSTLRNAKAACEQWYRQQLGKALRRVK